MAPFLARDIQVDTLHARYAVFLPQGYDASKPWPCIVFLHGQGESGRDVAAVTRIGMGAALRRSPERWPCIVLLPQKPRTDEEWEEHEDLVLAVLRDASSRWAIDPRRVALAGMSQGGHGTWMIGARHPELWSCLVPICGYGRAATIAPRVVMLPVWAFHGLRDDLVDPHDTERIVAAIRAQRAESGADAGDTVRMTLDPEANHGVWDAALATPELPAWILQWRLPGTPAPAVRAKP
jgi:predicted peptidase